MQAMYVLKENAREHQTYPGNLTDIFEQALLERAQTNLRKTAKASYPYMHMPVPGHAGPACRLLTTPVGEKRLGTTAHQLNCCSHPTNSEGWKPTDLYGTSTSIGATLSEIRT